MKSERMKHRITIQQQTTTQDGYGQPVNTWIDVATVWASIEPISGREFFAAQQVNAEVTTRIRIRYMAGLLPKMRVAFGTRYYEILSIIDIDERHREIQLMCKELVDNG